MDRKGHGILGAATGAKANGAEGEQHTAMADVGIAGMIHRVQGIIVRSKEPGSAAAPGKRLLIADAGIAQGKGQVTGANTLIATGIYYSRLGNTDGDSTGRTGSEAGTGAGPTGGPTPAQGPAPPEVFRGSIAQSAKAWRK